MHTRDGQEPLQEAESEITWSHLNIMVLLCTASKQGKAKTESYIWDTYHFCWLEREQESTKWDCRKTSLCRLSAVGLPCTVCLNGSVKIA